MYARVIRECPNPVWCQHNEAGHLWEYVNLETEAKFKRGQVSFFCARYLPHTTRERMAWLRS